MSTLGAAVLQGQEAEDQLVRSAVRTDLILSAEIMVIALKRGRRREPARPSADPDHRCVRDHRGRLRRGRVDREDGRRRPQARAWAARRRGGVRPRAAEGDADRARRARQRGPGGDAVGRRPHPDRRLARARMALAPRRGARPRRTRGRPVRGRRGARLAGRDRCVRTGGARRRLPGGGDRRSDPPFVRRAPTGRRRTDRVRRAGGHRQSSSQSVVSLVPASSSTSASSRSATIGPIGAPSGREQARIEVLPGRQRRQLGRQRSAGESCHPLRRQAGGRYQHQRSPPAQRQTGHARIHD